MKTLDYASGTYSDYFIGGVFRALDNLDAASLLAEYIKINPEEAEEYYFEETRFLGWLLSRKLIEPVDCFEWHLCSINEMSIKKLEGQTE